MDLIIGNKVIVTPIEDILYLLKNELTNGKLKDITKERHSNIAVTCPNHKGGFEHHPSCNVFTDRNDPETEYGKVHCFSCGYKATLPQFISFCFDEKDESFGEQWLLDRVETAFVSHISWLPPIDFNSKKEETIFLDESILDNFKYYHDYMWERNLTREIVDKFEVGYNPQRDSITFPVRDEKGRLVFITERFVHPIDKKHRFFIPEDVNKPVYLLNYMPKNVYSLCIVESQINALYMNSLGFYSVALFGTGSDYQYDILKKSGVRSFNLFFDGDEAGKIGALKFKKAMGNSVIVTQFLLPDGKDVNNLTKEEILSLPYI